MAVTLDTLFDLLTPQKQEKEKFRSANHVAFTAMERMYDGENNPFEGFYLNHCRLLLSPYSIFQDGTELID